MIENIVFDYGGVIGNIHDSIIKKAYMDLNVSWFKQVIHYRKIKTLKDDFINGLRPTGDVVDEILKLCGHNVSKEQLYKVLCLLAGELPKQRICQISKLHGRYNVFVLSNINELLWNTCVNQIKQQGFCLEECFHQVFLSYQMHMAKPHESIYKALIAEANIKPEKTLYFDDRKENWQAGLQMGFKASLVKQNHLEDNNDYIKLLEDL